MPNNDNRFAILADDLDDLPNSDKDIMKTPKPPPIYIREQSSSALVNKIMELIGQDSFHIIPLTKGNIHETKVQVKTEFRGYASEQLLEVIRVFEAPISAGRDNEVIATFYVIKNGRQSLLGRDTAIKLNVLRLGLNVNHIEEPTPFPKWKGVKVKLCIDPEIRPVQQPVRRIPVALEEKVHAKPEEALKRDIIEPVMGPSSWISPIVLAFKENGDIRICLKDAKFFSRLDLNDAYHQLELEESSRGITTFITLKGLFRYQRLMFGVNSAPEIFQRRLEQLLAAFPNAMNYIDDVIIFGANEHEHDETNRTRLIADASPVALGSVLLQFDGKGDPLIISFASKALSEVERRYSQTEKESLALVWAVEKFYYYLAGLHFELVTDHKPLEAIFKPTSKPPARIERCPTTNRMEYSILRVVESAIPKSMTISEIAESSLRDEEVVDAIHSLENNSWEREKSTKLHPFRFELSTIGPLLLRGNRIVIPTNLRKRVLELAHEGHPGESAMKRRLRSKVWWPLIDRDAEEFVKKIAETASWYPSQ
ncbi:uncharacterized protein K02A2.6-like [Drosophila santomea]|uniref:uncharacterized protein K02A2.6-like n=1 Tax=Drosophila santomea TaxID=129105 RepID=UPI001CCC96A4|nr:uncharacterized protein K02A2.6-like [Drosophila santomea]